MILGEWGTPHSTRPASDPPVQPGYYGATGTAAVAPINLDDHSPRIRWARIKPYFAATTTSEFLTTQWQTIKANIGAGTNQVCVGGFIFDWCDEYWKAQPNNPNPTVQLGGPDQNFQGGAFAGGYWDEAWFGITSAVDQSQYGGGNPNIIRTPFAAYAAVQAFYTSTTHLGSPL